MSKPESYVLNNHTCGTCIHMVQCGFSLFCNQDQKLKEEYFWRMKNGSTPMINSLNDEAVQWAKDSFVNSNGTCNEYKFSSADED